jgi:hypothetical protein
VLAIATLSDVACTSTTHHQCSSNGQQNAND